MYEIGDKVVYQGADKSAYKRVGVLKRIEEKDGKPQLTVEFEDGETFTAPVDDWSREFTNACKNAKFKVGDKVKFWMFDKKLDGKIKAVRGERVDIDDGHGGVVTFKAKDLEVWNSCTSTNSVVRNAMAANRRVARNGRRDDPATMRAYNLASQALTALEKARYVIGGAEDDDYAPMEAKAIDSAIGQVKAAIRSME